MRSKLYIRTDGSSSIGLGHLVRCIALARMLSNDFEIFFACKQIPDSIAGEIETDGYHLIRLKNDDDLTSILSPTDLVVIDSYELESDYQKSIKLIGCGLICIDDLHEKTTYADLILNHTPGVSPSEYSAQSYTQYALGPKYALIRPAFLNLAKKGRAHIKNESVLICFGGSDSRNLTKLALEVVLGTKRFKKIFVVTGAAYAHHDSVNKIPGAEQHVFHYRNISAEDMAQCMSEVDLCIVPSSGILTEALTSGAKIISGMYVENQRFVFENYKKSNAFISAEDFTRENLTDAVENYFSQEPGTNQQLIDGFSGNRIQNLFQQLLYEKDFALRDLAIGDAELTYKWAVDENVRKYSLSKGKIEFEEHISWLKRKLHDPQCRFYIASFSGESIGTIRFDIADQEAVISYLLDPAYHGKGLGATLLKRGILSFSNAPYFVNRISGIVMRENISSCKTFERFGFAKQSDGENYKYTMYIDDENRKI
ncbi:UDP-2,4-diacetamido-2,4,6-trideoxy-beta-L-altropyranose hydrolase [Dyadobacter aurulentus]|uniref:UDP-2,4-diacetamido-2,4, 6-trideoxy-beta-L-altropyranose hydrolase n=1 Tax=Dyadobacter sp. UC 10 TaxID=2605428 RepID=UPI0011F2181F|nr:UDP-2,4-diacetamido-2,4,6-trideoxy-beta-L-altropyranose hydrolase [Dyadobacter sp. UC 10]KAA0991312.1 UDP-2,4-diacetamido-2,4,6-trideoxy-beta-L-altropyranose hydrolase [Dyadobacter sp. UC 10]